MAVPDTEEQALIPVAPGRKAVATPLIPGLADQVGTSSGMIARIVVAEFARQYRIIWLSILAIPVVYFLRRLRLPEGPAPAMAD